MLNSVRLRLIVSYLLVGLSAALVVGLVTYLIAESYFRDHEIEFLTENADEVAHDVLAILEQDDRQRLLRDTLGFSLVPDALSFQQSLQGRLSTAVQLYSFLGQKRVAVLDVDGEVLADSGSAYPLHLVGIDADPILRTQFSIIAGGLPAADVAARGLSHFFQVQPNPFGWGYSLTHVATQEPELLVVPTSQQKMVSDVVVKVPIESLGGDLIGYLRFSEGPAFGRSILNGVRTALAGGVAAAIVLAVFMGVLSARQLTRPLAALGAAAERMAGGDLNARAPNQRRDEFGQLASQFNRMADELQATVERLQADREALRRFVADASHELRTPLTALKTFNTIWLWDKEQAYDPAMLEANKQQIERLDRLTQGLLDLSRLDAQLSLDTMVAQDLRPLLEHSAALVRPMLDDKGLALAVTLPEMPVVAVCDPVYLRRAVENLLSNAVKFTPRGGHVSMGLALDGSQVRIWVSDDGPGIPAEERPHVFDRFSRGSGAAGTEGSGLGLAIVKAVAEAHQGQVTVDCTAGCCFTILLPASQAPAG